MTKPVLVVESPSPGRWVAVEAEVDVSKVAGPSLRDALLRFLVHEAEVDLAAMVKARLLAILNAPHALGLTPKAG